MVSLKEKEQAKTTLIEMLNDEPESFKKLIEELMGNKLEEENQFNTFVKNSFKRFEETYKALA